ncbi:MAG: restriction endonuclease [Clostridia bacterium]|nr:restriction endonuclease [Clostridia bacterium]
MNIVIPNNIEEKIHEAVSFFWATRVGQIRKQSASEIHDTGNRGAVTGGKQLDGFVGLTKTLLLQNGVPERAIFTDAELELPGYFRPNKKWDLLVVDRGRLLAAIEFKSQVGPSFGNNFNNRTEEAMGSALDLWTAYREGVFGAYPAPFVGYFMVLEDSEKSRAPVSARCTHFPIRPEFCGASYRERYALFCEKLLLERQYTAACFLTTSADGAFACPREALSYEAFFASMLGHILGQGSTYVR